MRTWRHEGRAESLGLNLMERIIGRKASVFEFVACVKVLVAMRNSFECKRLVALLSLSLCFFCRAYLPLKIKILQTTARGRWRSQVRIHKISTHLGAVVEGEEKEEEPLVWTTLNYRRPLHFVLKIGSLRSNLKFFEQFGYKLFRHEVRIGVNERSFNPSLSAFMSTCVWRCT